MKREHFRFADVCRGHIGEDENLFSGDSPESVFFMESFPLMDFIRHIDKFDFKSSFEQAFHYNELLYILEAKIKLYLLDIEDNYILEQYQKDHLEAYVYFLRQEFAEYCENELEKESKI